jgi:hypothetical protein
MARRRRSDCCHAVYMITNTETDDYYIGITVCAGRGLTVDRALKIRWQKHVRRALTENKTWSLCRSIRATGPEQHRIELLETVRGRAAAHQRERALIREYNPQLNVA